SFYRFDKTDAVVQIELREKTQIISLLYYTGLNTGEYRLEFSEDGVVFREQPPMKQSYADLFKWQYAKLDPEPSETKYVRITADGELFLGELVLFARDGNMIPVGDIIFDAGSEPLFDERDTVPDRPSYLNSAYFDEIYHARTASEHISGIYPYEVSHPPLGKLIISLGIRLFGMTPFGWRFTGTLFGVLMLLPMYALIKRLFGSTAVAVCGTLVFAFDFMHFVQTRIATIDTYAVFFIILMYLFMYMAGTTGDGEKPAGRKCLVYSALSGICFGLGAACKWTALYGGAGLFILWALFWIRTGIKLVREGRAGEFIARFFSNAAWCAVFFIAVPCVIYYASYYSYGSAKGLSGISLYFDPEYFNMVIDNQKFMFSYHADINATHPYSSRWYQWIINHRPILYYLDTLENGRKSAFGAFSNPALCWGGLISVLFMFYHSTVRRDKKAAFILIGYLAQLVPWIFISRLTFEYHYFPSIAFLTLSLCYVFSSFDFQTKRGRQLVCGYTALCLILFVLFYPVLSGVPTPTRYTSDYLRWIPKAWPF
ncbi:MAG: phospholipid carrier-dependent glycosyltransferase, partial [Oscillospiraceae bacterium]|nr:phospholipid carrier-dependent glycosyltransferase [Oscillospiraceae bacterium]